MTEEQINERTLFLIGEIAEKNTSEIISAIIEINKNDRKKEQELKNYERKPILLYINSPGGVCYDGWSLIDIMLLSKTPITTIALGKAMSMGLTIFMAGSKRVIGEHATLMFHGVSSGSEGYINESKEQLDQAFKIQNNVLKFIAGRSKVTEEELTKYCNTKTCWYIEKDEAIKKHFATDTLEDI